MSWKWEPIWSGHICQTEAAQHRIELSPKDSWPILLVANLPDPKRVSFRKIKKPRCSRWKSSSCSNPSGHRHLFLQRKRTTGCNSLLTKKLNVVTLHSSYPIPRMDAYIDSFREERILSALNASSSFVQVKPDKGAREKVTYLSNHGSFHFMHMRFGMRSAQGPFQRAIDVLLSTGYCQFDSICLDDIVIFPKSPEAHINHVRHFLTLLWNASITIKLKMREMFLNSINLLFNMGSDQSHNKTPAPSATWCFQRILGNYDHFKACAPYFDIFKELHAHCGTDEQRNAEYQRTHVDKLSEDELLILKTRKEELIRPP